MGQSRWNKGEHFELKHNTGKMKTMLGQVKQNEIMKRNDYFVCLKYTKQFQIGDARL